MIGNDYKEWRESLRGGDPIVNQVCDDLQQRSAVGIKKYGTTLDANPLNLREWLVHAYEETLDQALYLKRAIKEIK